MGLFIGFKEYANVRVHVGVNEKRLEIGSSGPNASSLYEHCPLDQSRPSENVNIRIVGVSGSSGAVQSTGHGEIVGGDIVDEHLLATYHSV